MENNGEYIATSAENFIEFLDYESDEITDDQNYDF